MFDTVETISKSTVQHGPYNDRIYLMKLNPEEDAEYLIEQLHNLTLQKKYTKIFAKIPQRVESIFLANNFKLEAEIPGLYNGIEKGSFWGKYSNASRGFLNIEDKQTIEAVIDLANKAEDLSGSTLPKGYDLNILGEKEIPAIAALYKSIFQVYPFPVFDEDYLLETMRSHVNYYGLHNDGVLVAVSSAEMDRANSNAEMTDFATLPAHRGKNLSYFLLGQMIEAMQLENIKTVYTIARAKSFGMNKTFGRQGFEFGGTLINNTLIGESIESMNVWYRSCSNL